MKNITLLFSLLFGIYANAAAPFNSVSLQGFLKTSAGVPVTGTFNGKVTLFQNSVACWNTGGTLVPIVITDGAFSKTLSGGVSTGVCSGTLGSQHFLMAAPYTWTLELDIDADTVVETTFTNIPITAVPLAMVAETITGMVSGTNVTGGIFGAVDGSAVTNLTASNLSSGIVPTARLGTGAASATTYLRGDSTWQTVASTGEANTASNLGTGATLFKQKTAVNLEFRSLLAGSTKLTTVTNLNDVTIDVAEANLNLANIGGTLGGAKVSGGTFGAVNGSALTNLTGTNISTGTVPAARLGSGTPSVSTFLRGDNSWQTIAASGEVNTASNVGTGSTLFKQKTGADLEFRSLVAGSTRLSLVGNLNDVTIDVAQANLALTGTQISGGTFGAVDGSALTNLTATNLSTGTVPTARLGTGTASATTFLRGDNSWQTMTGEANTASNVGLGAALFKQKTAIDLEFRTLIAGSNKVSMLANANDVTMDVVEANLSLANIGGTLSGTNVSGGTFGAVNGSAITDLTATNISTGTVAAARLGSGIPSASNFLRGDNSWQTITGEANTASNVGLGAALFKQKTGIDLEFRTVIAGSTKLSLLANASDLTLDVVEANLSLANIGGTLSGTNVSGGTFGAVNGSALTNLTATNLSTGTVPTARLASGTASSTTFLRGDSTWQTIAAPGEVNTVSNLGLGSQIFKQKTGVDFELRSLTAGSTKVALTTNVNDISIDVAEANLTLANLTGNLLGDRIVGGTLGATDGSAVTNLNGTNVATGTVAAARLPQAGAAADGIVTSGAQTIGGAKTFNGAVTIASALTNTGVVAWDKNDVASVATITCLSSTKPVVRLTGTTATALQGISPGADGQILVLYADGAIAAGLTLNHNNAGACANGRIFTNTAANVSSVTAGSTAAFVFIYNLGSLRWHLITALQ